MRLIVGRCTSQDGVEILGILLRGHQALSSAGRAAVPIRQARSPAVVRGEHRLGLDRHLVHGTVGEINKLLWMIDCKERVASDMCPVSFDAVA